MSKKSSVRGSYSTRTTKLTTLPSKHSQSALEYMMTYGWAILIIVIVAAGLYSLGIFSPTNSASTSITGFSGLGSVQAECIGSQGLEISLGDALSNTINVTRINATDSLTGKSISVNPNLIIQQGTNSIYYLQTICPIPNTPFSATVTVTYMLVGATFPGPYQVSGNIYGKAISSEISSSQPIVHFVPITITNAQNTSTASPFQEMLNVTSFTYKNYEASNLQNVEFFYSNGTIIPSWIESGNSYTSNSTIYWLRVNGITSGSNLDIFMGFTATSENLFNSLNIGEAPQLSGTYGEYDDGSNVFSFYANFAGSLLPTGWSAGTGTSYSINNGLTLDDDWVYTNSQYPTLDTVTEVYLTVNGQANSYAAGVIGYTGYIYDSGSNALFTKYNTNSYYQAVTEASTYNIFDAGHQFSNGTNVMLGIWSTSKAAYAQYTGSTIFSTTSQVYTGSNNIKIAEGTNSLFKTYYIRQRTYPPNGVMPAALFGKFQ